MGLRDIMESGAPRQSFNMTPIIDIAFQLIIFFALACRFVEAENFPVSVPDACSYAEEERDRQGQVTTVTVMKSSEDGCRFAVGAEGLDCSDRDEMAMLMAQRLNAQLDQVPQSRRIVTLRIDKDVRFADAQYVLAAVARSNARDIQLATKKEVTE